MRLTQKQKIDYMQDGNCPRCKHYGSVSYDHRNMVMFNTGCSIPMSCQCGATWTEHHTLTNVTGRKP